MVKYFLLVAFALIILLVFLFCKSPKETLDQCDKIHFATKKEYAKCKKNLSKKDTNKKAKDVKR